MLKVIPLLIIAAASAGYLFCDKCIRYKYILPRDDGQRLYLRAITFGLPFLLFVLLINELLFLLPKILPIPSIVISKDDAIIYAALSMPVVAWVSAISYNFAIAEEGRIAKFREAMMVDDYDAILWKSMSTFQPVAVSLDYRKVYVGLVADGLEPSSETNSYLTILPLLSGHRDKDTLKLTITNRYTSVFKLLGDLDNENDDLDTISEDIEAYYMTFPRSKIISMHLFNDHLYNEIEAQHAEKGEA